MARKAFLFFYIQYSQDKHFIIFSFHSLIPSFYHSIISPMDQYVLRDQDQREIDRLGFQHDVWRTESLRLLDLAGIGVGQKVADLGCGPGFLSREVADLVGKNGEIHALDSSERFIGYLEKYVRPNGFEQLFPQQADITQSIPIAPNTLDAIVMRWVLMFVDKPDQVIQHAYTALKPGGTFAVMEYFNFCEIKLWPSSAIFEEVYKAVHQLLGSFGGDADLGGKVAGKMKQAGFQVQEVVPIYKVGKTNSPLWQWLERTSVNHQNLINANLISEAQLAAYHAEWHQHAQNPHAFLQAPPVMITIGKKPLY